MEEAKRNISGLMAQAGQRLDAAIARLSNADDTARVIIMAEIDRLAYYRTGLYLTFNAPEASDIQEMLRDTIPTLTRLQEQLETAHGKEKAALTASLAWLNAYRYGLRQGLEQVNAALARKADKGEQKAENAG